MSKRILIVDDDRRLCQELVSCLEEEGYSAEYALDGSRGITLVSKKRYDIVLLDVKIPKANGFDILIKMKEIHPETSVILITAHPFIEKFIKDENVSALLACFLKKPFSVGLLLDKIKTL